MEDQIWSARDRTAIAKTKRYMEDSQSLKVEVEELESLLDPDDSDSDGPSGFLAVSRTRRDKHQRRLNAPWRQNSSSSSSGRQWKITWKDVVISKWTLRLWSV